ncbi:nitroreductase/quinone reductase family protein [Angustibacter sp. McL0619]|uniref:nitroreductase/quinone reductase family protein n=1 Tax=Angustibacter sp. McL0619 TaxID=3415676 RepID=UPI003CF5A4C5
MSIEKLPSGTRGGRTPPKLVGKVVMPVMVWFHRRRHDTFQGMSLIYLTTVGAKSGKEHTTPAARFDQDDGSWVVCASAGGAAKHPGWYHNIVAHPDQVWAEVGGNRRKVSAEQLEGPAREKAWTQIVAEAPGFKGYLDKTDRTLPVLRLTPLDGG